MSQTELNLPAVAAEQAHGVLNARLYAPVFFTKLANDFGIQPANEQQAQQMLHMASQLRLAHDQQQTKTAASSPDLLTAAQVHLDGVLGQRGLQEQTSNSHLVKHASAQLANDPELAHAILSLQISTAS